jgi:hypothetical protein
MDCDPQMNNEPSCFDFSGESASVSFPKQPLSAEGIMDTCYIMFHYDPNNLLMILPI